MVYLRSCLLYDFIYVIRSVSHSLPDHVDLCGIPLFMIELSLGQFFRVWRHDRMQGKSYFLR